MMGLMNPVMLAPRSPGCELHQPIQSHPAGQTVQLQHHLPQTTSHTNVHDDWVT